MKKSDTGYPKTKLTGSYLTVVISVSLVLFLLGTLGLILMNARGLSNYYKENLSFLIMLDDQAGDSAINVLKRDLDSKAFIKSTRYVSKDEAAVKLKADLGEDFVEFLGENPLPQSLDVYLYASHTSPDSVAKLENYVRQYPIVKDVSYQKSLLVMINENVRKISIFLLVISVFLLIIALTLINNTIRLSIYSRRFIIRTMQLVGATRGFIRKPFLMQSVLQGLLAALIAICLIMGLLYLIEKEFFMLFTLESTIFMLMLGAAIILTGILINFVSTFFAVNKYLSIPEDKLYY